MLNLTNCDMKNLTKIGILICLMMLSSVAWAAKDPQYQFYSTSMLSPNKQSNYAPSHINQSGAVKVQLSANKRVPLYQMGTANGANTRVFSAEAFTKPARNNVASGMVNASGNGGSYTSTNQKNVTLSSVGATSVPRISMKLVSGKGVLVETTTDEEEPTSGPRRVPGTPSGEDAEQLPIGDGLVPLMLMALAFVAWKRRKLSSALKIRKD